MRHVLALGASLLAAGLGGLPGYAEQATVAAVPTDDARPAPSSLDTGAPPEVMASPLATAIRQILASTPAGQTDREAEEQAAITAFYEARTGAPLWFDGETFNARASALAATFAESAEWGLNPADFAPPREAAGSPTPEARAATEMALTQAALKYARYARGGRIMHPAVDLSSYLDRAPQLMDPNRTLAELAAAPDTGVYLRSLHPQHPQFEKLRQKYLAARGKGGKLTSDAKRLLANMEQWRWMPADMGTFYVWNNIPEYTQRVVADGQIINTERIVAGLLNKQTPIFSRPMKKIAFRPKWKVPESIKVREVWPSLLHGGGIMAEHGLQIETKDGQPVPIRSVDWTKADIREYEVIQPPGPRSVLGNFKFMFPNQHTVFMHDTQDKHLFAATQRTYSHGCMRVRNPARLAELIMAHDKGWDAAKIAELIATGPLNNEVVLDHKVPVHITYFTALVGEDGKVSTFRDVYGHERRITQALEGRWNEIVKGRDHLAPVEPDLMAAVRPPRPTPVRAAVANAKPFNFLGAILGGGF